MDVPVAEVEGEERMRAAVYVRTKRLLVAHDESLKGLAATGELEELCARAVDIADVNDDVSGVGDRLVVIPVVLLAAQWPTPWSSSHFSASIAAWQPLPAAVIAWR